MTTYQELAARIAEWAALPDVRALVETILND